MPSVGGPLPSADGPLPSTDAPPPSVGDSLPSVGGRLPSADAPPPSVEGPLPSPADPLASAERPLPSVDDRLPSLADPPLSADRSRPAQRTRVPGLSCQRSPNRSHSPRSTGGQAASGTRAMCRGGWTTGLRRKRHCARAVAFGQSSAARTVPPGRLDFNSLYWPVTFSLSARSGSCSVARLASCDSGNPGTK